MPLTDFTIRLTFAFILGALIGVERQWRQRKAGLRTNTLVATGSALFVMLSVMNDHDSSPTRIAAQVVSGVGFLGAGVIMRDGMNVKGIDTAATLWCAAAVGTLTGAGFLAESVIGSIFILIANTLLRPIANRVDETPSCKLNRKLNKSMIKQETQQKIDS